MTSEKNESPDIGQLTSALAACIDELQQARRDADKLAPELRILADCFDSRVTDVTMTDLKNKGGFTFRASKERREQHGRRSSNLPVQQNDDGTREPLAAIPDGTNLVGVATRIQNAKQEAECILGKLRKEGIDLRAICAALDCD